MELEKIAADLYREFPKNAEKLSREMERLSGLLEETGAAIMMEIEKEKYRKDKDPTDPAVPQDLPQCAQGTGKCG